MIYSISHTDLDGYASQLIIKKVAEAAGEKIKMFNVNYGKSITNAIAETLGNISSKDSLYITDLNLDDKQAELLNEKMIEIGFKLHVLDHHETGKNIAAKYDWYHYDKTKCATQITFEYFNSPSVVEYLTYLTNIYDLWQIEELDFFKAQCLNQSLMDRKKIFLKILEDMQRDFNFFIIENVSKLLKSAPDIYSVEKELYELERRYFDSDNRLPNRTLHTVKIRAMYNEIVKKELYTLVEIDGLTAEIYTGLSEIFQEFSAMRNELGEADFVANINSQGYIGFRSIGNINVADIAKKYFNGGGHKNAAGGSIESVINAGKKIQENEMIFEFIKTIKEKKC